MRVGGESTVHAEKAVMLGCLGGGMVCPNHPAAPNQAVNP